MISRFRAVLSRALVPCTRSVHGSVPRPTSLSVSLQPQAPSGSSSSAVLQRTNDTTSIQKRTMVDFVMTPTIAVELGKHLVDLWVVLYPLVKEAVDNWTDADQKAVARHVLRYASQPIPTNRVKCKDLFFSRPTVNAMLSKLVIDGRWSFLSGNSSTGKTMGMHYFVRDTMRALAKDRLYIPVTCHLRLREHETEEKCKNALAEAMGLDPASDSVKKRTVPGLLQLLSSTFEQLKQLHFNDSFICPIFWIDDVHSCNRSFVTELCATIVESGLLGGAASTIMTSSEHNTEFLKFLTGHSGTSKRLQCSRFPVVTEQEIVDFLQRLGKHPVSTTYHPFYDSFDVLTVKKHEYYANFKVSDAGIRMLAHNFRDRFDLLDEALAEIQDESKKGDVSDVFVKQLIDSAACSDQQMAIFMNVFSSRAMSDDPELYFTAVELFDALANSKGDPVDFISYDRRRVEKLCELNCLTRDLDVGNVGAKLVSSGTRWVQFKSRILSLTWLLFKMLSDAIETQRQAALAQRDAEADRKAKEQAAEADRKAKEQAAEADRKAKEQAAIAAETQRLKNAQIEEEILNDKARAAKLQLSALEEKLNKRNAAKSQSPKRNTKGFNQSKKW